jgi:hypothetical protein
LEITVNTDAFETDLRQALARQAAAVPAAAGERVRQRNYRPRVHSRAAVAGAGLVIAALAASGGAYLAGVTTGTTGGAPGATARLTGATITLDGYRFTLPAGFKATTTACTAPIRGGLAPSARVGSKFAAAASAHGGCVEAFLFAEQLTPPSSASAVQVGHHRGYVIAQPAEHRMALYVRISAASGGHWVVITAKDLSQAEVVTITARALG